MMKNIACPMCCNMGFSNRDDLKEHLQRVSTSLNCPFCSVSCKNVANLIKHLDVCTAPSEITPKAVPSTDSVDNDLETNSQLSDNDDDDDDDVEGYFCTVCDIKIPDVYKHIQQFHNGQEVILQDDDEDSDGSKPSVPPQSFHSDIPTTKRKQEDVVNGASLKNKKPKMEPVRGEAGENEAFYCPKCNISFLSLTEHANKYHQKDEVLIQDIYITDLFSEIKKGLGSTAYSCSSCQRTIPRPHMLAKHLRLSVINKPKMEVKSEPRSFGQEMDGVKLEPGAEFEIEEVKLDNYDFADLGNSIFGV